MLTMRLLCDGRWSSTCRSLPNKTGRCEGKRMEPGFSNLWFIYYPRDSPCSTVYEHILQYVLLPWRSEFDRMEGETAGEAARLLRGSGLHLSLPYITQELVIGSIRCKALPFSFFHVAQSHRFIQPLYCRCYHCLSPRVLTTVGEKSWIGTSVKKKKKKEKTGRRNIKHSPPLSRRRNNCDSLRQQLWRTNAIRRWVA